MYNTTVKSTSSTGVGQTNTWAIVHFGGLLSAISYTIVLVHSSSILTSTFVPGLTITNFKPRASLRAFTCTQVTAELIGHL